MIRMDYIPALIIFLCLCCCDAQTPTKPKNVLFLVADDMRPEIGAYLGPDYPSPVHPPMYTPNLDKLASKSLVLKRAYVSVAVCNPSRTSLLTSRRPDTTHVYSIGPYFRNVGGNFTTLPQYFKNHGYRSIGMGKIFHPGKSSGDDDPISWTEPYFHAPNQPYWSSHNFSWRAVPDDVIKDKPLEDQQIAAHAIQWLQKLAKQRENNNSQPFFMAVGFRKPHLPFVFPEEYLQYYPSDVVKMPPNPYAPVNLPKVAWHSYLGLLSYHDIRDLHASGAMNTTLPQKVVLELRRAYYSALTYSDAMLGKVTSALKDHGLAEDTIVSFWGDHGWQLGEHGEWLKQTNFELATHAPMMVHIPGLTDRGIHTEALTEFVDLYPTLVEAAGLPQLPLCPVNKSSSVDTCREGQSLLALINNSSEWKDRVFSQYPRNEYDAMGYTMRTDRYRYTEWVEFQGKPQYKPIWDKVVGVELYDHLKDSAENYNVFEEDQYHDIVKDLSQKLHTGWRAALYDV